MAGYDPKAFEEKWYARWCELGAFAPAAPRDGEETFSMVIPPPNVTGSLHMGHALNNTLQDIVCRYQRMLGKAALWLPGMDHAGIATQNVIERQLLDEGTDRHDLGREAFVERAWQWKEHSGGQIVKQLRRLGVSCDWSRERFTMDEGLSRAVIEVFVSLYEEGLISRDRYLINWCPRCRTALSDIEVEHEDRPGNLWHFRYPLQDGGHVSVATTRPETMLGDTAVAVNPSDARYRDLVGKNVVLPVVGRIIPLIADEYVDAEFGSGAVKITPGHDPNDFEIGRRHGLPLVSVMNEDGTMSEEAGEYAGMTTAECRTALIERFASDGTLERTEDYALSVGTCYRCHNVVEPLLSLQWFMNVEGLAKRTLTALDDGRTRFVPAHWEKTYRTWIENIRPWCISRQLWWGHRIPAWYCQECEETVVSRTPVETCTGCGSAMVQDEDVLDTWFSSGLWPFSTMGWPEKTKDLSRFYPTSLLITGFDIIFFWVARMMMMGLKFMDDVPFHDIYIHALVRDEHGQKMSKSKGNIIDPLHVIDDYGADALRFTLTAMAGMGRDIKLSTDAIAGNRNFVNKLWNASRFVQMNLADGTQECAAPENVVSVTNRWILSRLADTVAGVRQALDGYRFNEAAARLRQFTWHEYCDWYIEISKVGLSEGGEEAEETRQVLLFVLESLLRLLHPVVPFVTEELWQSLPVNRAEDATIMCSRFPELRPEWSDAEAETQIGDLIEAVRAVRNIRAEMGIAPRVELDVFLKAGAGAGAVRANEPLMRRLARAGSVSYDTQPPAGCATAVAAGSELSVPVAEHVDLRAEADRLRKELGKVDKERTQLEKKLNNPDFLERAPEDVIVRSRERMAAAEQERDTLMQSLSRFEAIGGST